MQGTFESGIDEARSNARARFRDADEEEGEAGSETEGEGSGVHLDAISNVPWNDHLVPANDRDTQKRMRRHREKEARYNALSAAQRARKPRVLPYPETPDRVFPGTPCYRIATGTGGYSFVFVVDTTDPLVMALFPPPAAGAAPWDGTARQQSKAYWIVPHFIYRDEVLVNTHRQQWRLVYDLIVRNPAWGFHVPSKFNFDSRHTRWPGAAVLPPELRAGVPTLAHHDSYYVPGVPNNVAAPPIKDPLFCAPFNSRRNIPFTAPRQPCATYTIIPYPYNQPSPPFPQRPDPPIVYAGRGAGPAAGAVPALMPVPAAALTVEPPTYHGVAGIDWIDVDNRNFEVGIEKLKDACMQAEEMDYAFALRIQGLKGSNLASVWACADPEYDVTDRAAVLAQFVKMYMEKFYNRVEAGSADADVEGVVQEALSMHEEFCKGWVQRHHRTLSAQVTAATEALVGVFYNDLIRSFTQNAQLTRVHVARYLMRHPEFSGEFAYCLYHYMTSLEQLRGNRNASYKAMQGEKQVGIVAMRKMATMLQERLQVIKADLQNVDAAALLFDPRFIDWHYISGQLPAHHKEFDGYVNAFSLYRTQPGGRANAFPPWQQMRFRG